MIIISPASTFRFERVWGGERVVVLGSREDEVERGESGERVEGDRGVAVAGDG